MNKVLGMMLMSLSTSVFSQSLVEPINIDFHKNSKSKIRLSVSDFNKISVKNEVITDFYYLEDNFNVTFKPPSYDVKDRGEGAIYITPLTDKPSVIFISTNKGHNFSIESEFSEKVGNTYIFDYTNNSLKKPSVLSRAKISDHEKMIDIFVSGIIPSGFIENKIKVSSKRIGRVLNVSEIKEYKSKAYIAKIYQVKNLASKNIKVSSKLFSQKDILAVAQDNDVLSKRQSMKVYTIERRGKNV